VYHNDPSGAFVLSNGSIGHSHNGEGKFTVHKRAVSSKKNRTGKKKANKNEGANAMRTAVEMGYPG